MEPLQPPAVSNTEPAGMLAHSYCGGPSRALWMAPAAATTGAVPDLIDLIAASLRTVCQDKHEGDRAFWLMARVLDRHLVDSLSLGHPERRVVSEAMDGLIGMLSQPLLAELHQRLEERDAMAVVSPAAQYAVHRTAEPAKPAGF